MSWTPLELAANFVTVICIFLAGRNSIHTWWTGIVASVLFGFLFYEARLFADVTLQAFFIVTGVIGWYNWSSKTNYLDISENQNFSLTMKKPVELAINYASTKRMVVMLVIAVVVAAMYGWLLHTFTSAYAPWIDSMVLTLSIVAQLLLMKRSVQTWHVWVAVNILSVPLFWSRELYLTSILYSAFLANAIWSCMTWIKLEKEQISD